MLETIQTALLSGGHALWLPLAVFVAGLMTSLTPCVYPMLPITVSVVGSRARSQLQAFAFSWLYVSGLALVYAALGVLAASSGQLFGVVASHPLTLLLAALLCLLMATWMMGWLRMPALQLPLLRQFSSAPLQVFIAGLLSGLVMAPCTSPVFGMLLMYVAGQGQPLWAALLMVMFALGMSVLLVLAGTVSGVLQRLPRSGRWMNRVQWLLAALMLAAALYLLSQAWLVLG